MCAGPMQRAGRGEQLHVARAGRADEMSRQHQRQAERRGRPAMRRSRGRRCRTRQGDAGSPPAPSSAGWARDASTGRWRRRNPVPPAIVAIARRSDGLANLLSRTRCKSCCRASVTPTIATMAISAASIRIRSGPGLRPDASSRLIAVIYLRHERRLSKNEGRAMARPSPANYTSIAWTPTPPERRASRRSS